MRFDDFQNVIPALGQTEPPGEKAHSLVFPKITEVRKLALAQNKNPRLSAVAAIFFPIENETQLLLIERQSYDGVHSGQIGFPGGKVEDVDLDLEHTARRETEEEVGIKNGQMQLLGSLSEVYIPPSGFLVKPYMFFVERKPNLILDPREVQSTLNLPLAKLLSKNAFEDGHVSTSTGVSIKTRYIMHENKKIWGATAMMLSELKILLEQLK